MAKPDYDTTLARIAGNIAGHLIGLDGYGESTTPEGQQWIAATSVEIARAIVQEIRDSPARPEASTDPAPALPD